MEKKKRYLLNCEVCDARKMHENLFDPYDEVVINADVLLVNEDARRNLSRYPIQLNGDNIVEAEGDVDVQVQNGWMELKCGQMPARKTVVQNFVQHHDGGTGGGDGSSRAQNAKQRFHGEILLDVISVCGSRECDDIVQRLFGGFDRDGGQHRAFAAVDVVELVIDLCGHSDPGALLQRLVAIVGASA